MVLLTIPSVVYGSFANEYIRFSLMLFAAAFTFFTAIHFIVRLIVSRLTLLVTSIEHTHVTANRIFSLVRTDVLGRVLGERKM